MASYAKVKAMSRLHEGSKGLFWFSNHWTFVSYNSRGRGFLMISLLQEENFPPFISCMNVCMSFRKTLVEIEPHPAMGAVGWE